MASNTSSEESILTWWRGTLVVDHIPQISWKSWLRKDIVGRDEIKNAHCWSGEEHIFWGICQDVEKTNPGGRPASRTFPENLDWGETVHVQLRHPRLSLHWGRVQVQLQYWHFARDLSGTNSTNQNFPRTASGGLISITIVLGRIRIPPSTRYPSSEYELGTFSVWQVCLWCREPSCSGGMKRTLFFFLSLLAM